MYISGVGRALPQHYYDQQTLVAALKNEWAERHHNVARLESLHQSVAVGGRHLALPIDSYPQLKDFTASNSAFIDVAVELGEQAITDALRTAELDAREVDHIFFVSSTGIATPSIDARLVNRMGLRRDIKRSPMFGLGCVAGAASIARATDYLKGAPHHVAVVLSVELCSLTLQRRDLSLANIIASGLFGDGAAAVVLQGPGRPARGPQVLASRSVFYPDTEYVMGWDVTGDGFKVVLSADVPKVVQEHIAGDVDAFLAASGLSRADITSYVCHPGGPKVLQAFQTSLELPADALALTHKSLREVGNLSSASVLMILRDTILERRPPAGSLGLLMAMGPAFCAELVLLRW